MSNAASAGRRNQNVREMSDCGKLSKRLPCKAAPVVSDCPIRAFGPHSLNASRPYHPILCYCPIISERLCMIARAIQGLFMVYK